MKIPPLTKSFGGRVVLNSPELELEAGRIYALIGANGSGKSTLARILAGVECSDNGHALSGASVGYLPQKSYAFRMSTRANVMLGGRDVNKCSALMNALHLTELAGKPAYRLSGGETARMALCRLMMSVYDLTVLDEPTASMDMESTLLSEKLMADYCRESGCCLLLVTHSIQQARRVADEVLFLYKGELVEMGEKDTVLSSARDGRTKRFLEFYGL